MSLAALEWIGGGAAALALLVWVCRRIDVGALSDTVHEPPREDGWEETLGEDGPHRLARRHSFEAAFAEQQARAERGEVGRHD